MEVADKGLRLLVNSYPNQHVPIQLVPKSIRTQCQPVPKSTHTQYQLVPKPTRTQVNSYPIPTRTQTNSYPSQPVPNTNSYPSQLIPNTNSYPSQPVPNTNSYPSQLIPNTNSYPSQPVPNTNSYPNQLVPKSTHTQIRRQRRLLSWVRDGIGYGLALGTGWLGTIELTGKRDLYTPCSRVSFQMTLSDLVHLFITLLNWYELRLMVLYIQGGDMVRFTHILLNGGRKNLLFHFLTFQCRMQSLPMLNYLSQVFSYLLKSSVSK